MRKAERDKLIDSDNRKRLTIEEVKHRSSKLHPHIEILTDEYTNDKERFSVRCNKCSLVFETTYNNLRQGNGCRDCANAKTRLSQEEFDRRMAKAAPWFEVLEPYKGAQTKIHVMCKECGHIQSSTPVNLYKGPKCKQCRKRKRLEFLKEHESENKNQ